MILWTHTLAAVLAVGAASLVGALFLGRSRERLDTTLMYLVSLSAGVLVGGAVIHLLPRAFDELGGLRAPLYFLAGFLGFFFLERYLWALHHDHSDFPHTAQRDPGPAEPVAAMTVVGGGFHNFIDGAMIAAAFSLDLSLGWITTLAVLLHEIPREFGDFGILVRAGLPVRKALQVNALSGLGAVAGAVLILLLGSRIDGVANALVAITAGNFVYIAAANLIPEIHHHHPRSESVGHALVLLLGVALMLALALLEPLLSGG
ncbi:MAG: ZIP family metal transporter [Gemmatimonadetes bacterium]|nr:ZIP family metal transporter [Gemmatimonadota bacterium]